MAENKMMTVTELNRGQLIQLKQLYLEEYLNNWADENEPISYNDIINADEIIPDETIFEVYSGTFFTEDDFWY